MATEGLVAAGASAALGALRGDLRGTADLLIKLACAARNSIGRCQAMADKVKMVTTALESRSYRYDDVNLQANLEKLLVVMKDCVCLVEKHSKTSTVSFFFSCHALTVDEFDDLDARLNRCISCLNLNFHISSYDRSHEHKDEIIAQVQANTARTIEEIKQLVHGQEPVEYLTAVQGVVTMGEALAGDYMISATLTDNSSSVSRKVILVQSHETKKEVAILEKLSLHECILEFLGIFPYGESKFYLVFERPSEEMTTLDELINKNPGSFMSDWRVKRQIALELARGMRVSHLAGVVHKNFRSSNIFLSGDLQHAKIFGFYQGRIKLEPSAKKWMNDEQVRWAAPEQVQRHRPAFDEKCDIYSLGVVIWELITGNFPFAKYTNYRKLSRDRSENVALLDDFPVECKAGELGKFSRISELCRDPLPDNRPSLENIINDLHKLLPEEMI
ncbi:hypothetical protein SELMODRAFT_428198 [Selaginella moellendorffii]|uniref:Protein kinase domain-containing protein n=1 Tax=Selaginella moellendorffii TaxID=88036 RepID=D8T225_SELML|nr:hypothetical protein SELMODRAFT_428198 [Selaginella moellendorffii]